MKTKQLAGNARRSGLNFRKACANSDLQTVNAQDIMPTAKALERPKWDETGHHADSKKAATFLKALIVQKHLDS